MAKKVKKKSNTYSCQQKLKWKLVIPLILLLSFLIYFNTLETPFILDDNKLITDNSAIQNGSVFTSFNLPRYVGYVSFGINYKISKFNPISYHIVNILIHCLNAMLIIILLAKLFSRVKERDLLQNYKYLPYFVALLFVVHPLQTQAVTYIVQRLTSLAAMFVLLSLILYIKFRESNKKYFLYCLSLFFAILAYKTKENTATLPLMIVATEAMFLREEVNVAVRKKVVWLIPFFILIILIPLSFIDLKTVNISNIGDSLNKIESTMQNIFREFRETTQETKLISRQEYLITEFNVILTYIRMLFYPANQSLHHIYPLANSLFEIPTFFSFLLLILIIVIAILLSREYIELLFGVIWFYIFLLVESSIIPIQDVIFEHRVYLPSIGIFIVFIYGLFFLIGRIGFKVLVAIVIVALLILSILTYRRNLVWKDEISIWKDVINKYPLNYIAHGSLGTAYGKINQCDKAIDELKISLDIYPKYAKALNNLGTCYVRIGNIKEALEAYYRAIELDPNYIKAYYNLASLYYINGDIKQALFYLLLANEIDNSNAMVNGQLGSLYCQIGNYQKSMDYFKKALSIEPDNATIRYNYNLCIAKRKE